MHVSTKFLIALSLALIGVAGVAMWLTRPSAIPVHPAEVFTAPEEEHIVSPEENQPTAPARKQPEPAAAAAAEKTPEQPLNLSREKQAPVISDKSTTLARELEDDQTVTLDFSGKGKLRPKIPKIKLFDPEYGTRGFSSRRWVSDNLGIEAGVGLTDGETLRERDAAAGVGVVISFD